MVAPTSLSISELVQRSGTSRRTIVYYIQKGLLPRVGRRGPNTRYPAAFLHRLGFINYIKGLQDDGELPTVTLDDAGRLLARLPADDLAAAFGGGPGALARELLPPAHLRELLAAPEKATASEPYGLPSVPPASAGNATAAVSTPTGATMPSGSGGTAEPAHTHKPATIGASAGGHRPVPARQRSYGLADAGIRQRADRSVPDPSVTRSGDPTPPAARSLVAGTVPGTPAGFTSPPPEGPPPAGAPSMPRPAASPEESQPGPAQPGPGQPRPSQGLSPGISYRLSPGSGEPVPMNLGALLRELELRPAMNPRRQPPGAPEQWTEVPIASRVWLSVRGLAAEDMPLLEAAARLLKKTLREG